MKRLARGQDRGFFVLNYYGLATDHPVTSALAHPLSLVEAALTVEG